MKKRLYLLLSVAGLLLFLFNCTRPVPTDANDKTASAVVSAAEQPVRTWDVSPIASFSGNLNYVFKECSFTSTETSCDNLKKGIISISVPAGCIIKKAYLFWSG